MSVMQSGLYLNLGLFGLLIGLIVIVMGLPKTETIEAALVTIASEQIYRIQISKPDAKEPIILVKQSNVWYMQQPKQALVNPIRMAQLLTLTNEAVETDYDVLDKNLSVFGLTPRMLVCR